MAIHNAPFVPTFGVGGPLGTAPTNQLYFDINTTPFAAYVFEAGAWHMYGGGSGAVASVGLSLPSSVFTVSGSPVTSSGTLTGSLNTQTANTIFAGPTSGAAAVPTFRTLSGADLNSLGFTAGSVIFANASGGLSQNNSGLFWNNTSNMHGINTAVPDSPLTIDAGTGTIPNAVQAGTIFHMISAAASSARGVFDGFGTTIGAGFTGRCAAGTRAAPTAIAINTFVLQFIAQGYNGSAYVTGGQTNLMSTEAWGVGTTGMGFQLSLTPNGTSTRTQKWFANGDGRIQQYGALCDFSYSYQTPSTGFAITIGNTVGRLLLDPAGTLATGTITMPATPLDGQVVKIASTQAITALTLSPNTGQTIPTPLMTLIAGGSAEYTYVLSQTKWIKTG